MKLNAYNVLLSVLFMCLVLSGSLEAQTKKQKTDEEGYIVRKSGLKYKVLEEGEGKVIGKNAKIKAEYTLAFPGEEPWHSSKKDGGPFPLDLSTGKGAIKGWLEALPLMKMGAKWQLYVPYQLAYGVNGRPPAVPPSQDLVFEIHVVEVVRK